MPLDAALEEVGDAAETLAAGEGSAIAAAAAVGAISLQKRPDAETLALWLADVVLAHRFKWPAPVPLIAGQIRRSDVRAAARRRLMVPGRHAHARVCPRGARGR